MPRGVRSEADHATEVTEAQGSNARGHDPRDSFADDRMGIAPYLNPELYADAHAKAQKYLFARDDDYARATDPVVFPLQSFSPSSGPGRRPSQRRKKAATPVRNGLLGVSAAVATREVRKENDL